ncbi:chromosome segregation protein [Asanoa hainanensis]|uniref:Chromosome segregation protein n=1 Tax=Asanoa hainanensis TaxID=560556 RepID=A0A239PFG9_9ACTN|nr:hypothetical protein [Asanoa hainanensis]SNT65856.1 chromosome segregation protein [Asanoa hainanensis]
MTVETIVTADSRRRPCAYPPCGRLLPPYAGRGRPVKFCPDDPNPRWPDGKTCQQMDAARKSAERATGLDVPLDGFRGAAGPLVEAAAALADQLIDTVTLVRAVDGGALARIADAEQAMGEALARAEAAERDRDQADRDRHQADTERARAVATAADAERRAEAARRDAERRVREATDRLADLERQHGQALAAAEAARAAQADQTRRREIADQRAATFETELAAVRAHLDATRADLDTARAQTTAEHDQRIAAEHQLERTDARNSDLTTQIAQTQAALDTATTDRDQATARARALTDQLAVAEAALEEADADARRHAEELTGRATAAEAQRDDVERRYQALVAALAAGGFTPQTAGEDDPQPSTGIDR